MKTEFLKQSLLQISQFIFPLSWASHRIFSISLNILPADYVLVQLAEHNFFQIYLHSSKYCYSYSLPMIAPIVKLFFPLFNLSNNPIIHLNISLSICFVFFINFTVPCMISCNIFIIRIFIYFI